MLKPKDIITDMQVEFGIEVLYGKALKALQHALSLTYGSPDDSYQLLPSYCYVLRDANPGTVTALHIDGSCIFSCLSAPVAGHLGLTFERLLQ